VDEELAPGAPGDLTRFLYRFGLGPVHRTCTPIRGDLDAPTLLARHDMNIAFGHGAIVPRTARPKHDCIPRVDDGYS
jgi:hypothetical protein